ATVGTPSGPAVTAGSAGWPRATVPASGSSAGLPLACAIRAGRDQVRPPSIERAAITSETWDELLATSMTSSRTRCGRTALVLMSGATCALPGSYTSRGGDHVRPPSELREN